MNESTQTIPEALLLLAPGCPHCPSVLQALGDLVKSGDIGRLEAVNIAVQPERAAELGVRSVPWVKLGPFELGGLRSAAEYRQWASRAGTTEGMAAWFDEQFREGRLHAVIELVKERPEHIDALLMLAADPDTELTSRIGVSAVLEDMRSSAPLRERLPKLAELAGHADPRVRSDACHFLALTDSPDAVPLLERLTEDPERAVRDVADDSLDELRSALQSG
jgi:thiol-disulfide isomerase/thioredoxin